MMGRDSTPNFAHLSFLFSLLPCAKSTPPAGDIGGVHVPNVPRWRGQIWQGFKKRQIKTNQIWGWTVLVEFKCMVFFTELLMGVF